MVPDELKDRLNEKAVSAAVSGETKLLVSRRNGRDGQRFSRPLQYLLKPLNEQIARTFRER